MLDPRERLVARVKDPRWSAKAAGALAHAAEPDDAAAGQEAAAHDEDRCPRRERRIERPDHAVVLDSRGGERLSARGSDGPCVEIDKRLGALEQREGAAGPLEVFDQSVA